MMGKIARAGVWYAALVVVAGLPLGAQEPTWLGGHTDFVRCVAVLPDGRAVSGGDDTVVKVWDIASEELAINLEGHEGAVRSVATTADGRVVSATDAQVRVWQPATGACLKVIADDCAPIAVTADGLLIAHASGDPHAIHVRDLSAEAGPRDLTWDTDSGVGPIAVTRDRALGV
jgi:WD40 repeat protein